jgi:hypothetical protein
MSFPGTYNIRYYFGDTLEFRVFPRNSSGEPFDLSTFTSARFTLARTRNTPPSEHIPVFATIDPSNTNILCAIRPEDCAELVTDTNKIQPTLSYVYDVEVSKPGSPYDIVYTLLTGSVTITRDVTRPETPIVETLPPNNPTDLTLGDATENSLSVSWTAPTSGDSPASYLIAAIPFTLDRGLLENAISASGVESIEATATSILIENLDPATDYSVIVRSENSAGLANIDTILFNIEPFRTADPEPSVPAPPVITSILPENESLEIFYTLSFDGNREVTNYKYSLDGQTYTAFDPPQTGESLIITGLTNGVTYSVTIRAVNDIGDSESSNSVNGTPQEPIVADFFVSNDGSTSFLINGVANDSITLIRGETYVFEIDAIGHPFWIQSEPAPYNANAIYNEGIEGNGSEEGIILWVVDESAPNTLYYVCENHSSMSGVINIINAGEDEYGDS